MFDKEKLSRDGVQGQALVLEKKVYASGERSGRASACRYQLRVRFEDGSSTEISRRVFGYTLASAAVGDLIPVRYDPANRSSIEIDRHAIDAQHEAAARELKATAIERGKRALDEAPAGTTSADVEPERRPDTDGLRIGDADREVIASVLSRHMEEGRLTIDELDDRLGVLYGSQTRVQASAVLAGLPPLDPVAAQPHHPGEAEQHEPVPVLPGWARAGQPAVSRSRSSAPGSAQARRPGAGGAGGLPSDEEITVAHQAWRAKVTKMKADNAVHKRAEAGGDPKETFLAFRRLAISKAEEKSARAKFDQLRKRRPDWTDGAG